MQKVGNPWEIYTSRLSNDSLDGKHSSQFTMFVSKYQQREGEILFFKKKSPISQLGVVTCYLPDSLNICWGSQARSQQHIGNNLLIHIVPFFLRTWTNLCDSSDHRSQFSFQNTLVLTE